MSGLSDTEDLEIDEAKDENISLDEVPPNKKRKIDAL